MGFSEASIYAKVSLPWIIVGFIFHIVGFPTDAWIDTNGGNAGLFRSCGDLLGCLTVDQGTAKDWYKVSQAFQIIGFLFLVAALITAIVYTVILNNNRIMRLVAVVVNSTSIVFIFIGFVVYAGRYGEVWSETIYDLGWSFALVVVSYVCLFIGLVCQFLDMCIPTSESVRLHNPHA
ncbi:uncharacterized protein LOC124121572 [Haliotis rufescens]|uniref:uncharacterized protein LOC124121572 n=1 Tax=Haliotis rufescens TaxID=6454 RepID=UPI001EB055B8|nr:uncharacterized protein LOC124121572 [Haliotis rufescens]